MHKNRGKTKIEQVQRSLLEHKFHRRSRFQPSPESTFKSLIKYTNIITADLGINQLEDLFFQIANWATEEAYKLRTIRQSLKT